MERDIIGSVAPEALEAKVAGQVNLLSSGFELSKVTETPYAVRGVTTYSDTCTPFSESCGPSDPGGICHPWQVGPVKDSVKKNYGH